ncbi:sigma-70 family RNA polymerase sigma factor [Sphingomonas colocasiae]|uniref:Sigma-70 family RNA polymerase sigma factor n=1 Tax=Sphingomonas colocasiae TaxID=1848973 RepID=A0ABS7PNB8_9SPHN|nr:sigma-70 family RNA polymerase sigma factor [Sphingomonas colocasiae]MBY8822805.1 sigma-70 family RNA polymerase sigma factor [Sphingomonas colocasiae]
MRPSAMLRSHLIAVADRRTTSALYGTHRAALVDYAAGIVGGRAQAEDVVQDAWLRIEQVERGRMLEEPLRYFYRVVRNLALDRRRALKRETRQDGTDSTAEIAEIQDEAPSPEDVALDRDELKRVVERMATLPERTRTALIMHRVEGRKLREIAEHLGISIALAHALVADGMRHCGRAVAR